MDRLIVKNFGPLKDIDIKLNKINLFIGENGSGKSILAKLIIIFNDIDNLNRNLLKELVKYNINFVKDDTVIEYYKSNIKVVSINGSKLKIDEILEHFSKNINFLNHLDYKTNQEINKKKLDSYLKPMFAIIEPDIDLSILEEIIRNKYKYIPAERSILSILNESINSLIINKIPIPDFLLNYASDYERSRKEIKELYALNITYKFEGSDNIYYDDKNYLRLSHSSSGIQSAIPMLLTIKYFTKNFSGIIIEEPEQNLFPKSQKEVVEFIAQHININNSALFVMTHSPYILTSFNNLILANDVLKRKGEDAIKDIVDIQKCISFEDIAAYSIENGKVIDIMDRENRLIGVNIIDNISDEVSETFDQLLERLY